jgi:hypothetical protein
MILAKYCIFILISMLSNINAYFDVCVVGASSGLGKELVYQSLNNYNLKVLALTSNLDEVKIPYRGGGLNDDLNRPAIIDDNLKIENYWKDFKDAYDYKNIIFTTSSTAFKEDYSFFLTKKILNNLSSYCENINLVSAHGVGDSLDDANLGIKIMENFYLKDVYYAKNRQEELINNFQWDDSKSINPYYKKNIKNKKIIKKIYRPKVLTYGKNVFNGQSRQELASIILDNLIL